MAGYKIKDQDKMRDWISYESLIMMIGSYDESKPFIDFHHTNGWARCFGIHKCREKTLNLSLMSEGYFWLDCFVREKFNVFRIVELQNVSYGQIKAVIRNRLKHMEHLSEAEFKLLLDNGGFNDLIFIDLIQAFGTQHPVCPAGLRLAQHSECPAGLRLATVIETILEHITVPLSPEMEAYVEQNGLNNLRHPATERKLPVE